MFSIVLLEKNESGFFLSICPFLFWHSYCHNLGAYQGTAIRDRIQERLRGQASYLLQNGKEVDDDDEEYYDDDDDEQYYDDGDYYYYEADKRDEKEKQIWFSILEGSWSVVHGHFVSIECYTMVADDEIWIALVLKGGVEASTCISFSQYYYNYYSLFVVEVSQNVQVTQVYMEVLFSAWQNWLS